MLFPQTITRAAGSQKRAAAVPNKSSRISDPAKSGSLLALGIYL